MFRISAICLSLFVGVGVGVFATENREVSNKTRANFEENYSEVLENLMKFAVRSHFVSADEEDESNPIDVLNEVYTECIPELSFPCLQKKFIIFLCKLDRMKNISLIGKSVLLVRKSDERIADSSFSVSRMAEPVDQAYLKDVIDNLINKFFENHSLRLRIPENVEEAGDTDDGEAIFLDIDFGSTESSNSLRESRRRRPPRHNRHHKGIKKLLMLIGLMTCIKLAMLGPLMLGLLALKAKKALILAVISLAISKMMMLSKVNMHSLLHGNQQWYSSGGGGWDRNIQDTSITSTLPYNMEPPAAYSTYSVRTVK